MWLQWPPAKPRCCCCPPPLLRRSLIDDQKAWEWVQPGGPGIGAFVYQTFTLGAFDNFNEGA